jgi:hypothetical protein
MKCRFIIEEETPERLVIADVGHAQMSVTNDAEAVVEYLLRQGTIRPGVRLLYYDSEGRLDELKFDARGFVGFAPYKP